MKTNGTCSYYNGVFLSPLLMRGRALAPALVLAPVLASAPASAAPAPALALAAALADRTQVFRCFRF